MKMMITELIRKFQAAFILMVAAGFVMAGQGAEVRIPASLAYQFPERGSVRAGSSTANPSSLWAVWITTPGKLDCSIALRLSTGSESKLRLTLAGISHEVVAKGQGGALVTVSFGSYEIAKPGYQRILLESLDGSLRLRREVDSLLLDGPASKDARYHRTPAQRGAPSVHLSYPLPSGEQAAAFYCEVTAVEDPVPTYYMACGWHRGYFGMQVNSPTERRIIFSVWDSGGEAVSRDKVASADRVTLVAKSDGVFTGDFGNEGTGGHSHLVYNWKTGEKQRFVVTASLADATHTIYAGYWYHPEQKKWMLISSWKAPKEGKYMNGLYSFSEDFGGTGLLRRKALFGNQWYRTPAGEWHELTTARFSHTGRDERFDRCMGVENGQFFLASGAFEPGTTKPGETYSRPALGKAPEVELPAVPAR